MGTEQTISVNVLRAVLRGHRLYKTGLAAKFSHKHGQCMLSFYPGNQMLRTKQCVNDMLHDTGKLEQLNR